MATAVSSMSGPWAQGGYIRPFLTPRSPTDTSIATGVEEDYGRRKRRRTSSPESRTTAGTGNTGDPWERQLRAATQSRPSLAQSKLIPADGSSSLLANGGSSLHIEGLSNHVRKEDSVPPLAVNHIESELQRGIHERSGQLELPSQTITEDASGLRDGKRSERVRAGGYPIGMPEVVTDVFSKSKRVPARSALKSCPATSLPITLRRSSRLPDDRRENTTEISSEKNPKKMMKVRADGRLTSPEVAQLEGQWPVTDTKEAPSFLNNVPPATGSSQKESTPTRAPAPKKLLKIRSDGKLASPNCHAPPDGAEKKRRGRPKKSADIAIERIVIMRYGKTDNSRQLLGQRIQHIFSGSKDLLPTSAPSNPGTNPSGPLKSTHPFFLRKLAKKSEADLAATDNKVESDFSMGKPAGPELSSSSAKWKLPAESPTSIKASSWRTFSQAASSGVRDSVAGKSRLATDTIWPPQDMVHIRQISEGTPAHVHEHISPFVKPFVATKLKGVRAKITEKEEVLHRYTALVQSYKAVKGNLRRDRFQPESLRIPSRRVMEGPELQKLYKKRFFAQSCTEERPADMKIDNTDNCSEARYENIHHHPALSRLYDRIANSRTAFDRFECEIQDWPQKYAPRRVEEILQPGREALILRDWLRSLAVNSVEIGSINAHKFMDNTRAAKKQSTGLRKKKRYRAGELDGFVVSSDEEANEMDELDDGPNRDPSQPRDERRKKTEIRTQEAANLNAAPGNGQKSTNAIVISGPCGCGKTAAIYAASQELGFEVFEINAGSRRNGKDILDRVGDMSRNHLVSQSRASGVNQKGLLEDDLTQITDALKQDIDAGRQGTMSAFLQPKKVKKRSTTRMELSGEGGANGKQSKQKTQKQSVILLEEVDVLFEEDKQFWTTTLELIVQSKRPVIMTCTEESLLPLDDLPLFGILRFRQPPQQLANEFLSLLACNEGHLLSTEALSGLYEAKDGDLRASITELQFFCQMGLGDTKGGLEWMLVEPAVGMKIMTKHMRVVSDGTYLKGMGWRDYKKAVPESGQQIDTEIDNVLAVCHGWGIDVADQDNFLPTEAFMDLPTSPNDRRRKLRSLDLAYDALSAADTLRNSVFRNGLRATIEVSAQPMSEKQRANYVEGIALLEADVQPEPLGVSDSLASALRVVARRTLLATTELLHDSSLSEQSIIDTLPRMVKASRCVKVVSPQGLSATFLPLSKPSVGTSAGRGPLISSLDRQVSVVVEDIAPYIRSIVSYDLRLEEHRKQLDLAFHGERSIKRARTTRASRAALEGGSKANTRRERWFPTNTDFEAVLETGGIGWQEEAIRRNGVGGLDTNDDFGLSRRSSVGSIESTLPDPGRSDDIQRI